MSEQASQLHTNVRVWARAYLRKVRVLREQGFDLDSFVKLTADKEALLRDALLAYRALVEYVGELDFPLQPSLVLPLTIAPRIVLEKPGSVADVIKDMRDMTAPQLCLRDWTDSIVYDRVEMYRCPLSLDLVETLPVNTVVYYRSWYKHVDDADGWQRDVVIAYYPPRYQLLPAPGD